MRHWPGEPRPQSSAAASCDESGWKIVDRIFAKNTSDAHLRREEDRQAILVEPTRVIVPTFG